jgi:hypothetical protein
MTQEMMQLVAGSMHFEGQSSCCWAQAMPHSHESSGHFEAQARQRVKQRFSQLSQDRWQRCEQGQASGSRQTSPTRLSHCASAVRPGSSSAGRAVFGSGVDDAGVGSAAAVGSGPGGAGAATEGGGGASDAIEGVGEGDAVERLASTGSLVAPHPPKSTSATIHADVPTPARVQPRPRTRFCPTTARS